LGLDPVEHMKSVLFHDAGHRHPNVVDFHAAYEDEHDVYLVMELCEGASIVLLRALKQMLSL
jgi:serine/threonine protein kinase